MRGGVGTMQIEMKSIEEFAELYGLAMDDPKIKDEYWKYQRGLMEQESHERYLNRIEREAHERGEKEGIEQGRDDLAAKLRALGIDEALLEKALAEE